MKCGTWRNYYYNKWQWWLQGLAVRKVAGIYRYEKVVLAMTAAFVLTTGAILLYTDTRSEGRQVKGTWPERDAPTLICTQIQGAERPRSLLPGEQININTADEKELTRLPGIGPGKAEAIVEYRTRNGPFSEVEQLRAVSGIGPRVMDQLRDYVVAGEMEG